MLSCTLNGSFLMVFFLLKILISSREFLGSTLDARYGHCGRSTFRVGLIRWDPTPPPSAQRGFRILDLQFYGPTLCLLSYLAPQFVSLHFTGLRGVNLFNLRTRSSKGLTHVPKSTFPLKWLQSTL